jgi:cytoskeletal protein CcmA (bactofilin family)
MAHVQLKSTEDRKMSDRADDLDIPMRPIRRPQEGMGLSRTADLPRPDSRPSASPAKPLIDRPVGSRDHQVDVGTLIVGREVLLTGEINSCDRLVIDGSIEGNLPDCRSLIIGETGAFKGCVSTQNADVRGRYDGDLVVHERLMIRASARVSGTIICAEIEIECGAKVSGDIQAVGHNEIERPPVLDGVPERDPALALPDVSLATSRKAKRSRQPAGRVPF